MRYLLTESQSYEISGRCEYLHDIFGLYFVPQDKIDGFIPLVPIGTAELSIIFIIGHQDQVMKFLKNNINQIAEETIVIVTCLANTFKLFRKTKKRFFFSTAINDLSYRYCGNEYGFAFDLTESELNFYNSSETDIMQRLENSFQPL